MASPGPARTLSTFICSTCRTKLLAHPRRPFSATTRSRADDIDIEQLVSRVTMHTPGRNRMRNNMRNSPQSQAAAAGASTSFTEALDAEPDYASLFSDEASRNLDAASRGQQAHRLHVYASKHNTHITLVQAPRAAADTASLRNASGKTSATEQKKVVDTLMSLSTGNIGFKKAGRGSYDAAFQLAAFVLRQMQEKGVTKEIKQLEVVLRGFGAGREAVTKALLGTEGRYIRQRISAVVDATRLKQGGPRSKKPRRLG